MFAFASVAALVCLFLAGLLPALRISRVDLDTLLKSGAGTGANRHHRRRYGVMVIAQIGFALPVLIGAVIVIRAAILVGHPDSQFRRQYGYDPSPLVVSSTSFRGDSSKSLSRQRRRERSRGAREIGARACSTQPWSCIVRRSKNRVMVDDENGAVREEPAPLWSYGIVSPQYLRTLGRTIEHGRDFFDGEFDGRSVIIDAPTARFLWGNRNPIGRVIKFGDAKSDMPWLRVVGVLGDERDTVAIRRVNPTANYRLGLVYRVITPTRQHCRRPSVASDNDDRAHGGQHRAGRGADSARPANGRKAQQSECHSARAAIRQRRRARSSGFRGCALWNVRIRRAGPRRDRRVRDRRALSSGAAARVGCSHLPRRDTRATYSTRSCAKAMLSSSPASRSGCC